MEVLIIIILIIFVYTIAYYNLPLFWDDAKWTIFIYRNIHKVEIIDNRYFKLNSYIIVFHYSWLFEVYEGQTKKEIRHKYALGRQSNKADHLTWWERVIGKQIEDYYLENLSS